MVSEPLVVVFATDEQGTLAALQHAKALVRSSPVRPVVLVPELVEYGCPLDGPSSPDGNGVRAAIEASYRDLASRVGLEVEIRICRCREPHHVGGRILLPPSHVILGGHWRSWRQTREQRLAHELMSDGHDVTFIERDTGDVRHSIGRTRATSSAARRLLAAR